MRVTVIGAGYVGLATSAALTYLGNTVTCLDIDASRIKALVRGEMPIYEPALADLARQCAHRLTFTDSYAQAIPGAEVIIIAVGTPALETGASDLTAVQRAAESIGEHLDNACAVIVNKSTAPIGTSKQIQNWVSQSNRSRNGAPPEANIAVVSSPEFLREGSGVRDTLYPDRLLVGADDQRACEIVCQLYRPIIEQDFAAPDFLPRPPGLVSVPLIVTDIASSELTKYAANAFLAMKISFINEIAELAERVDADITQVSRGIGLDPRIGAQFLNAGIGWGGPCFDKDTAALVSMAAARGLEMDLIRGTRAVNARQRRRTVSRLECELGGLDGKVVGLLGLAFKPNTNDLRDAPSLDIAQQLLAAGAIVRAHDPQAPAGLQRDIRGRHVVSCDSPARLAEDADALVLVTEWPQYRDLEWEALARVMRRPLLLDGRNALDPQRLQRAGFRYLGMGRFSGSAPAV